MITSAPALAMAILVIAAFVGLPPRAYAAEAVTVYLLDAHYEPVVRLEKLTPPLSEGLRALLAMYALQDGGGCESNNDPQEKGLHCELTTALGVGPQCSEAQLRVVRAWFKTSIPSMNDHTPDQFTNIQRPGALEDVCYAAPNIASYQRNWERIRVKQAGTEVSVDSVGSWMARDKSGHFHYKTIFRIEDHSITTVSHTEIPWKGDRKQKDSEDEE
jgi:hypothetical protein